MSCTYCPVVYLHENLQNNSIQDTILILSSQDLSTVGPSVISVHGSIREPFLCYSLTLYIPRMLLYTPTAIH